MYVFYFPSYHFFNCIISATLVYAAAFLLLFRSSLIALSKFSIFIVYFSMLFSSFSIYLRTSIRADSYYISLDATTGY